MSKKSSKKEKQKKNTSHSIKRKKKSTTLKKQNKEQKILKKSSVETLENSNELKEPLEVVDTTLSNSVLEEKKELSEEDNKCPHCGVKIIGKYCSNCGKNLKECVPVKAEIVEELISQETEVLENSTSNIDAQALNPLTVPSAISIPSSQKTTSFDAETILTPPINPIGSPGIMPIPNAGMEHNVMKYHIDSSSHTVPKKKKPNKMIFFVVGIVILIAILFLCFFLIINKHREDNSKMILLSCTLREENFQDGIDSQSVMMYIFQNNLLIKTINEETLEFSEETIKYYGYYESSLEEMMEEETGIFDNVTLEMKKTKNTLTSIYTVDLTADSSNSNNNMEELGYTYYQAKKELEKEGYICK